ncbi:heat-shock protein, partial [Trifolium medium]|nr:heat-shock protein [Trifolium medium]
GAAWLWRRQLWAWEEEMLKECRSLLSKIVLQPNVANQWVWRHDPGGGYTVQGAYNLLTFRDVQDADATSDLIWRK